MSGPVRVAGNNKGNVWFNDMVKAAFERKGVAWKELLGANFKIGM